MSILMDALKQQSALPAMRPDTAAFWRKLALVLALLVALLSGALLAYWLQPSRPAPAMALPEAAAPARPADILAVLQHSAEPDSALQTPKQKESNAVASIRQQDVLVAENPIPTVTAGSETVVAQDSGDVNQPQSAKEAELVEVAVSDELRDKFSAALKATESFSSAMPGSASSGRQQAAPAKHISELDNATLRQIPPLRFDAHVYATSATQRWVKVNGKTLQEGQWVTADIRIREITQQYVLLELGNQLFSIAALSEWPGNY